MKKITKFAIGLIIVLSVAAYANALPGDFIWDDWALIVNNESIKSWDNLPYVLNVHPFQRQRGSQVKAQAHFYYRPVITLSYMLDYSLWGTNPSGYHVTNLLWHIANGIIVYLLACFLLKREKFALIASLLFAVHPVHSESVSWIAGRTDVICGFFFFSALYLYCLGGTLASKRKILLVCLSLLSFLLGLYSKEMVATLPLILILIDYFVLRLDFRELSGRVKYWLPYWGILFLYLFVRLFGLELGAGTGSKLAAISKFQVLLTFGRAAVYYLQKLFLPFDLSAYVIIDLVTHGLPLDVLFFIVLFVASLVFVYLKKDFYPEISFLIIFFWISLLPISNLIPINAPIGMDFPMAERFLYIPSFAFCGLVAILLSKLDSLKFKRFSLTVALSGVLILFYSVGTIHANTFWNNGVTLFSRELKRYPESFFLMKNVAYEHIYRKDCDSAIPYLNKVTQIKPDDSGTYYALAHCHYTKGDIQKAMRACQLALKYNDNHFKARYILANCYWKLGQLSLAADEFVKLVKVNPNSKAVINALKKLSQEMEHVGG